MSMTSTSPRKLKTVYCTIWRERRLGFHYTQGRWAYYEVIRLHDIREAIRMTLERLEQGYPGALAKAAEIDDHNWLKNKRRTRRYIADMPEHIYIDSPHLIAQSEAVCGFHVPTNISWVQVPEILRLACQGAGIQYASFRSLTL